MLGQAISKNSLVLGLFAIATTAMIASTFLGTKDLIAEQERIARAKALLEVIPVERHDNSMLDDTIAIGPEPALGLKKQQHIFVAKRGTKVIGFIFPVVAPDGYSGDISMIVGVNLDGTVAGVRVLTHAETPGLGDKVELKKSDWIMSFNAKSLTNPKPEKWKVKKDKGVFDQFTGATITPRAVTNAVYKTLTYYAKHQQALLNASHANQEASNDG